LRCAFFREVEKMRIQMAEDLEFPHRQRLEALAEVRKKVKGGKKAER
jgi:hypothetical protein